MRALSAALDLTGATRDAFVKLDPRLMAKNRRPYKTKDGYVCCLIYTDRQWKIFLEAVGKGDLLKTDPRFAPVGSPVPPLGRGAPRPPVRTRPDSTLP